MEADPGHARLGDTPVEGLGDPVRDEWVAPDVGEDDAGVCATEAEGQPALCLADPVGAEGGDRLRVQVDRAPTLVRLGVVLVDWLAADWRSAGAGS
jgi:hypothetical protein